MEQWIDIEGYEGLYQVSNLGSIRSLYRFNKAQNRLYKGKIRTLCFDRRGYNILVLCKEGTQKTFKVHRLVAHHFITNTNNKTEVNHIDGDKTNNHVNNLEWCTPSENVKHSYKIGIQEAHKGEAHINAKLTNEQAQEIRNLKNSKSYSMTELAYMYKVSIATISLIMSGRRYNYEGK